MSDRIAALEREIRELRALIVQLRDAKRGPSGEDGRDGKDGKPGRDCKSVDAAQLASMVAAEVRKQLSQKDAPHEQRPSAWIWETDNKGRTRATPEYS